MDKRSIISSSIGNVIEWYDFGLFAIYSPILARIFFPTTDERTQLIATFTIFAVGFLCRPLGAFIFGYLGDKQGRAKTLRFSILMICLPTLLIGCLPTYNQVGLSAAVLLSLIRIWQGISIGGEYTGNIIYIAEMAPKKNRAAYTSLAPSGSNLGILLATLVGTICNYFFSTATFYAWGWRIPYLLSGILSLFVYLVRLKIKETQVFSYLEAKKLLTKNPISAVFKNNMSDILRTMGMVLMGSTFYYFSFIYLPLVVDTYLKISLLKTFGIMTILFVLMLFLIPLSGWLCDRIGRRKMLLFNAFIITISIIPAYYFLLHSMLGILFTLFLFTIFSSLEQGTTPVAIVENFPPSTRYTGISFAYNFDNGIFSGTVPLICTWLSSKNHFSLLPAVYIAFCAFITLLVIYCFVGETKNSNLVIEK